MRRQTVIAVAAAAIVLAGCGDGEDIEPEEITPEVDTTQGAVGDPVTTVITPTTTASDAGGPAPDIVGTSWNVTLYDIGGAMTNPWPGTEITFTFESGDTISGFATCNDFTAGYEVSGGYNEPEAGVRDPEDGQAISISDVVTGDVVCEDDSDMTQELEFLAALESSARWKIGGEGVFNTSGPDGFFRLEAEPAG